MLEEILNYLKNFFVVDGGVHRGEFTISSNSLIGIDFLKYGQYYRIVGSVFNDGVYQYGYEPCGTLADEDFSGEVWALAIPKKLLPLVSEIEQWCSVNTPSGYLSESFGGYSYTRGTLANTGVPIGWKNVFESRLVAWKKVSW